ncbi:hypothetical protein FRACYDRAFT_235233 [Fragilariopsis cylindrus CCMP1102]|uniref:Asparagine synthetase domain-containing protein n=1 Tax=Fragilariopsis cylindrus CCMP1102 TaxID=635003 RepID=A0A1E7FU19_9STRA|nr:hypothetical protein FRACYDRAFT_235233 [Fragilariopsis cylindrus CCMP1102]|eukprot:OEU21607.1 hypothetical protein FRACYDRAFT_235233 [Fragilariopsis cylindrus CCMP1102]
MSSDDEHQLFNNKNENERKSEREREREERAIYMSNECRQRLIESMKKINSKIIKSRNSGNSTGIALLFSGGLDSCAILEVASIIGMKLDLLITVVIGEDERNEEERNENENDENEDKEKKQSYSNYGPDLEYSIHAVASASSQSQSQPKHIIIKLTRNELISQFTKSTIQTLACWGRMDIRNSLVISAAMNYAALEGITDVVVGDGGDELFGGYEFMFGIPGDKEVVEWKLKRNAMINQWTFVTTKLGNSYGLKVHEPYMDQELFIDWTLQEVERYDCISDAVTVDNNDSDGDSNGDSNKNDSTRSKRRGIQSIYNGPYYRNETYGKVLLREAFPTSIAAYRRMDFIDRGSGAISINEEYWTKEHHITDDEFQIDKEKLQFENDILITCKEHLYNIRLYQEIFGHSLTKHPTKKHYPKIKNGDIMQHDRRGCIGCCFEIQDAMFCHNNSTSTATQIRMGYVGPLAVNDKSDDNGLPWCINNDGNDNACSADTTTTTITTTTTTIDITMFLISCTADGSVNRSVRKITRKLKNNNAATTTATRPPTPTAAGISTSTTASAVVVGLLGHARCDNSSKQMADTIFGTNGRKFDKALQQQQQQQSSSNSAVSKASLSTTTRLETQVELYGPEQDFDPWLEGLLQQFII